MTNEKNINDNIEDENKNTEITNEEVETKVDTDPESKIKELQETIEKQKGMIDESGKEGKRKAEEASILRQKLSKFEDTEKKPQSTESEMKNIFPDWDNFSEVRKARELKINNSFKHDDYINNLVKKDEDKKVNSKKFNDYLDNLSSKAKEAGLDEKEVSNWAKENITNPQDLNISILAFQQTKSNSKQQTGKTSEGYSPTIEKKVSNFDENYDNAINEGDSKTADALLREESLKRMKKEGGK